MYCGHVNEKLHTTFRNSGRVAGTGILYDRYDEESGKMTVNELHKVLEKGEAVIVELKLEEAQ